MDRGCQRAHGGSWGGGGDTASQGRSQGKGQKRIIDNVRLFFFHFFKFKFFSFLLFFFMILNIDIFIYVLVSHFL